MAFLLLACSQAAECSSKETAAQRSPADGPIPQAQAGGWAVSEPRLEARSSPKHLESVVQRTAKRYGVERALVLAVIAAESAYDPSAVSRAGAVGLMQVMPATAADYGVSSREALFDPETNIRTGTRHLKRLLSKYGNDYGRAIMAYNAGEGVVDRTGSRVTYAETLDYTEAVVRHYRRNGGVRPTEQVMRKVRALRRIAGSRKARRSLRAFLDPPVARASRGGSTRRRGLDASLYEDLADGYLDSALRSGVTGGVADELHPDGL